MKSRQWTLKIKTTPCKCGCGLFPKPLVRRRKFLNDRHRIHYFRRRFGGEL